MRGEHRSSASVGRPAEYNTLGEYAGRVSPVLTRINRPDWDGAEAWGLYMPVGIFLLTAAQGLSPDAAACRNLMREFIENEVAYSIVYDMNRSMGAASMDYATKTGDYSKVQPERQRNRATESEFVSTGDRLTGLMAARHCPLPDHVTNPATYRAELAACHGPGGTSREDGGCGIVDRALERAFPKPQPRRKKKR